MRAFFLIAIFGVVGAVLVFQATRTTRSTVRLPSEILAPSEGVLPARLRVAGRVSSEEIVYLTQPSLELRFRVIDPPAQSGQSNPAQSGSVVVLYKGVKPDMFAPGRDVILEGRYVNGVLEATQLLTQCPSKYEAPDPAKQYQ